MKCKMLKVVLPGFLAIAAHAAFAASQNECAIWLCLPDGFPSGCGAAHSAMINRIRHRKSPLPDFGSCSANPRAVGGARLSYQQGYAAYIPPHEECSYDWFGTPTSCSRVPAQYVDGQWCTFDDGGSGTPAGCTGTASFIKVFTGGRQAGKTYYWGM
ncbi:MAG: conjugal transfer protein TraL [Betaproteobacteria bacterium]|nr:conjugal transfer protein TraL [Betaproteobacteria bacterium]